MRMASDTLGYKHSLPETVKCHKWSFVYVKTVLNAIAASSQAHLVSFEQLLDEFNSFCALLFRREADSCLQHRQRIAMNWDCSTLS